jgi:hypothetical protein
VSKQHRDESERGVHTPPRSAPLDGRAYSRRIECADSAVSRAGHADAVARARGVRRRPEEPERPTRPA